jgi:threonyl-tRNA synthetase
MSNNITITFPDGNTKSIEKGISGFDLANQISKSLAKESVAIQIDGTICDLSLELNENCKVVIIKRENEEALDIIRHDCAHVMAEAVQSLFPGTQVTIGPSIENGFYYDFARKEPFTLSDLPKIEKKNA